jgi:hypothetical protein
LLRTLRRQKILQIPKFGKLSIHQNETEILLGVGKEGSIYIN